MVQKEPNAAVLGSAQSHRPVAVQPSEASLPPQSRMRAAQSERSPLAMHSPASIQSGGADQRVGRSS